MVAQHVLPLFVLQDDGSAVRFDDLEANPLFMRHRKD
jgi:hypothetical protein